MDSAILIGIAIVSIILIIIAELLCYLDNNREFFYHIIKTHLKNYNYNKKKGKLPTDIVHITKIERILIDQNHKQAHMPVTKHTWTTLCNYTNHKHHIDTMHLNIKIDTNNFTQFILNGINKQLNTQNEDQ